MSAVVPLRCAFPPLQRELSGRDAAGVRADADLNKPAGPPLQAGIPISGRERLKQLSQLCRIRTINDTTITKLQPKALHRRLTWRVVHHGGLRVEADQTHAWT